MKQAVVSLESSRNGAMSDDKNINLTPVCQRMPVEFYIFLKNNSLKRRAAFSARTDNMIIKRSCCGMQALARKKE